MAVAIAYLLWILFAIYEGKREALYFSFKMKASLKQQQGFIGEHSMFIQQRAFVGILTVLVCYKDWMNCIVVLCSIMMCFPFFKDGMYYVTRQKLDNLYMKGWLDKSPSSKLHLLKPIHRTLLFISSLALIAYEIIKFWK